MQKGNLPAAIRTQLNERPPCKVESCHAATSTFGARTLTLTNHSSGTGLNLCGLLRCETPDRA